MSSTDLKKELDKALAETERLRRENEELKLQVKKSLYVNKESPDQVANAVSRFPTLEIRREVRRNSAFSGQKTTPLRCIVNLDKKDMNTYNCTYECCCRYKYVYFCCSE